MTTSWCKPISVRCDLRPGDIGRVTEMHGVIYAAEYGFDHRFEAYVAATLAELAGEVHDDRRRLWIAERDGALAGSAGVVGRDNGEAQLRWLLVHPAARGQGLGRQLVDRVVEHCRVAGYRLVFLWTVDVLAGAARLYRSAGFRMTEERPPEHLWGVTLSEQRYDLRLDGAGAPGR